MDGARQGLQESNTIQVQFWHTGKTVGPDKCNKMEILVDQDNPVEVDILRKHLQAAIDEIAATTVPTVAAEGQNGIR